MTFLFALAWVVLFVIPLFTWLALRHFFRLPLQLQMMYGARVGGRLVASGAVWTVALLWIIFGGR